MVENIAKNKEDEMSQEEKLRTDTVNSIGKAGAAVKEGVVSGLKGINEIETRLVTWSGTRFPIPSRPRVR